MGLTRIRTPKHFVLEERLERYAAAIEVRPETYRGQWAQACWPSIGAADAPTDQTHPSSPATSAQFSEVHLDLGCGKGAYLIERARREPDYLFIGMDTEPICIAYAAQYICEAGLPNALVLPRGADALPRIFAPGELAAITLNFPTPYPRHRYATRRLVHVDHLLAYRQVLAPQATVTLRTDSQPLRDYALAQFDAAGYQMLWASDDTRHDHPEHPATEYETRLAAQGAPVYGLCATLAAEPNAERVQRGRDAEQSLMQYLPEDLDTLAYVPLGMGDAVTNLRNRRRHERERRPS